mmetsp:Transcript_183061/g.580285  ORF Transcript_183061/g.580285 Transcript_183061/m.580285 type:complete len:111 (+) Transcript_183061:539-871(+)
MDASGAKAFRAYWYAPVGNPQFVNYTAQDLETYIIRRARFYGASRAGVLLLPNEVELDVLPFHVFANQRLAVETDRLDLCLNLGFWSRRSTEYGSLPGSSTPRALFGSSL